MQYIPKHTTKRNIEPKASDNAAGTNDTTGKLNRQQKKFPLWIIPVIVVLALAVWVGYAWASPGKYDAFAKCLSEKGVVMYGEDWCPYTKGQKTMFGKSFKYVNYEIKKDLAVRPTWVINGETYEKVQSFERLSALTGCKY